MSNDNDKNLKVSKEELNAAFGNDRKAAQLQQQQDINEAMSAIKHKIIVCSGKGGVGKTTVSVNLAMALAKKNLKVGILDVDITGPNVPKMLGLEGQRPNLIPNSKKFAPVMLNLLSTPIKVMSMAFLLESDDTPVIWRGPLKMGAIRQFIAEGEWGDLDYLVIDLPPGTSDETLDILQLTGDNSGVVIVTTPQDVAVLDASKTVNMAKQMQRPIIGILENMSGLTVKCSKCGEEETYDLFGSDGGKKAAERLHVPFIGKIPIDMSVREQGDAGEPFVIKYPESTSSKAFDEIVANIQDFMESNSK